jgi:hypothetical protein
MSTLIEVARLIDQAVAARFVTVEEHPWGFVQFSCQGATIAIDNGATGIDGDGLCVQIENSVEGLRGLAAIAAHPTFRARLAELG